LVQPSGLAAIAQQFCEDMMKVAPTRANIKFHLKDNCLRGCLVVGSGVGANQLVVFVNAMNEMGKIFESPVKLEKKVYKFEPMALAA
jgi:hypothetical protein